MAISRSEAGNVQNEHGTYTRKQGSYPRSLGSWQKGGANLKKLPLAKDKTTRVSTRITVTIYENH